jgi:hypothetical protein
MKEVVLFNYLLKNELKLYYNKYENKIIFYGKYGTSILFLPNFFFVNVTIVGLFFLFVNKKSVINFIKHFFYIYNSVFKIFFIRMKLRGLGYRIIRVAKRLYRFFFAVNHYFYFHIPNNIYIKRRARELFIISNNRARLNDIFHHLLYLKKLDLYERTNSFIVKNKILHLKKRK